MPVVSIIIPAYNAAKDLSSTVNSVLRQSEEDWELVVVDDGSTDETLEVARSLASTDRRIQVYTGSNAGVSAARNKGFRATSASTYVQFLDADDILEPKALSTLIEAISRSTNSGASTIAAMFGASKYIDAAGEPLENEKQRHIGPRKMIRGGEIVDVANDTGDVTFEMLLVGNQIQTPGAVLIPRASIDAVGDFDSRMSGTADWHYWLRLSLYGRLVSIPETVLAYRVHESSMSRNHGKMLDDAARTLRSIAVESGLSNDQLRDVETIYGIQNGVGAGRVEEWHAALTIIERTLNSGVIPSTPASQDATQVNAPLYFAVRSNLGLVHGLSTENRSECRSLTENEVQTLVDAKKRVASQLRWIYGRRTLRALRHRRISDVISSGIGLARTRG